MNNSTNNMGPETSRLKREVESLGWLAESGVMPKKKEVIEGVGAGSLLDLKAQVYRTQENVRRKAEGLVDVDEKRKKSGFNLADLFAKSNAGVEGRINQDALHLQTSTDKASECYKALEKKAALYEKIARGEVDDEDEIYNVDFVRKGVLDPNMPPPSGSSLEGSHREKDDEDQSTGGMMSRDMQLAMERESWEAAESGRHREEVEADARRRDKRAAIEDAHQEANTGRARVQALKDKRKQQMERNRERLRTEFLKKKLQQIKEASNKTSKQGSPPT